MCTGRCRGEGPEFWTLEQSVPIESEEEEVQAGKGWELFQKQYPAASKRGIFIDTPVEERDVKYRWRRLKSTFGISSEQCNELIGMDAVPLVVDSDFVQMTWNAMVKGSSKEEAWEVVGKNPAVLTAGEGIEQNMPQAKIAAGFIAATRPLNNLIQMVFQR